MAQPGGHYHKATVNKYRGVNFVQLPSPEPKSSREFTIIRITADRLITMPFNCRDNRWVSEARKVLNVAIKGPVKATAAKEQVHP